MKSLFCNLCSSCSLELRVDLGYHPCADTFHPVDVGQASPETFYPLRVVQCKECGHMQLDYVVPAEIRYQSTDYSYDSSNSTISESHFQELATQAIAKLNLGPSDLIIDAGSNVGTLLASFRKISGCDVLGIDPSANICDIANRNGIQTINAFFDESCLELLENQPLASLVTSTNSLNHAESVNTFILTALQVIRDDGHIVIEVPYSLSLFKSFAFDTIYLEHINYFLLSPLRKFLKLHALYINHVELIEYMCGSIRLYVSRNPVEDSNLLSLIQEEIEFGIYNPALFVDFQEKLQRFKLDLLTRLLSIKNSGGVIVGVGAATKGNTLLNFVGIDSSILEYITDASPLKIGKRTPGSRLTIVSDSDIGQDVTHALILPWNIFAHLVDKLGSKNLIFLSPINSFNSKKEYSNEIT